MCIGWSSTSHRHRRPLEGHIWRKDSSHSVSPWQCVGSCSDGSHFRAESRRFLGVLVNWNRGSAVKIVQDEGSETKNRVDRVD